jgi:hypothetical protein
MIITKFTYIHVAGSLGSITVNKSKLIQTLICGYDSFSDTQCEGFFFAYYT